LRLLALVALAACGHPEAETPRPAPISTAIVPPDAAEATQEERLAAIQKAMNELSPTAQACWAAAAVERFDIEGELTAQIDIAPGKASVSLVRDTARNPKLASCMTEILTAYPWAPPLHGQTIQLPFKFRAPDGQSVIERPLVPWNGQGKVSVAVFLDENNSANEAASMFGIRIAPGGATGLRITDRPELWYFETAAEMRPAVGPVLAIAAGDMVFVPANGYRNVVATDHMVTAMIAVAPGGREGAARGGALPTPESHGWDKPPPEPRLLAAKAAKAFTLPAGRVTIFAEPVSTSSQAMAASILELHAGAKVPEHAHATETELLYVLAGTGAMVVGGVTLPVTATSVIQIPPATKHSFTATTAVRAVQIYAPAGPEQRFK
jgi:mannose-6-phosphate isomerase-like protein (cupin superfamily)